MDWIVFEFNIVFSGTDCNLSLLYCGWKCRSEQRGGLDELGDTLEVCIACADVNKLDQK